MAERQSMTTAEVVAKTLIDEHADFLREAVAVVAAQLMEAEISTEIGAGRGEVCAERSTHRNGYRERRWETRVGEIDLLVPRKRSGEAYFPSFLEPRRPAEQAIVSVVMEAYVNGVSTRKVDRLVEQLGIHGMSKDRVSALCRALDERVEAFRKPAAGGRVSLPLARRQAASGSETGGHVRSKALVVAYAVHETGRREVIGIDLGEVETEAFWVEFLRGLRARGLGGVRLAVSDHHEGLKAAIAQDSRLPLAALHRSLRAQHARATAGARSAGWSPQRCARSSTPRASSKPSCASVRCWSASASRCRRSPSCSRPPRRTCSPSTASPPSTGRSFAPPTPWSGSTRRSDADPTSSASSPTTPRRSGSPAPC